MKAISVPRQVAPSEPQKWPLAGGKKGVPLSPGLQRWPRALNTISPTTFILLLLIEANQGPSSFHQAGSPGNRAPCGGGTRVP